MSPFMVNYPEIFPSPQTAEVAEDFPALNRGHVKFRGSRWRAKAFRTVSQDIFQAGQNVMVIGREGLTLLIQPFD